ncbi:MAG: chemotaxis-specific protein-glutamate methyltransferase CheB [Magnetococcus sp. YQC-3]
MAASSLKVMVVDDSTTYRMIVRKSAEAVSGVEVVDFAANGRIALEKLSRMQVDVLLLDVEMPEMDGLATLRHVVTHHPDIVVVMVSGASHANANIVVECLNLGAFDFVTKPLESDMDRSKGALMTSLRPILSLLANRGKRPARLLPPSPLAAAPSPAAATPPDGSAAVREKSEPSVLPGSTPRGPVGGMARPQPARPPVVAAASRGPDRGAPATAEARWDKRPAMLLIGSSTGGPAALTQLLGGIAPPLSIPAMIVQHMPPMFTTSLAAQLSRSSGHRVQEAEHDQEIKPGVILLAPGGKHLVVKRQGSILRSVLHDGPKVNGCRPAVDVLFMSVMAFFDAPVLAVILTGMGNDGANGVKGLKRQGKTYCITQSRDSCVVYGMPRVVEEMGLSDASIGLEQLGAAISALCR